MKQATSMHSFYKVFLWPIIIGLLTLAGLVVALVEDGVLEHLSLSALTSPILVIMYVYLFKRGTNAK